MALTHPTRAEAERETSLPSVEWSVSTPRGVFRRALLAQFLQFCLVGALSTVLNLILFNLFWAWGLGVNGSHVAAFTLAVTNGFFLNRAWTFRRSRAGKMKNQYAMFVAVNLVGLGLSWAVMRVVGGWLLQSGLAASMVPALQRFTAHRPVVERLAYSLGELAATPLCAVWNFSANKLWTFRSVHR